jgi:hypothetical protein
MSAFGIVMLVAGCLVFTALVWAGVQAVKYARRGSAGAHVLGAVFILLGFGNMQDPTMQTVAEAKQRKGSEEDDSGDPPDPDGQ